MCIGDPVRCFGGLGPTDETNTQIWRRRELEIVQYLSLFGLIKMKRSVLGQLPISVAYESDVVISKITRSACLRTHLLIIYQHHIKLAEGYLSLKRLPNANQYCRATQRKALCLLESCIFAPDQAVQVAHQ